MKHIHKLKLYIGLILSFAKNSLASQMEYRVNFIAGILVETGFMLAKLTYVILIYKTNVTINGMTPDYILMFIGTYAIMTGIFMSFYPNFCNISAYVKDGTLDTYLSKPVSQLFLISFRYLDFAMPIPNLLGGMIMVIIGWNRCKFTVNILNVFCFLLFIFFGSVLTYAIFLLPRLLAFWVVSTSGITQISDAAWDFNNMPMGIYNRVIQGIGSFLFPVFLITNIPGLFIAGKITKYFLAWAVVAPIIFLTVTIYIWKKALKHYSSASS
jgi:ABC-2 type transport system permease protein